MPKGEYRNRPGVRRAAADKGRQRMVDEVLKTLDPYIIGCARTLGIAGSAKGEKPGNQAAAKIVLDFVTVHGRTRGQEDAEGLLKDLAMLRSAVLTHGSGDGQGIPQN